MQRKAIPPIVGSKSKFKEKPSLRLTFNEDTPISVSQASLRAIAEKLGFGETLAIHYALARLRDELLTEDALEPLTAEHHRAIAKAEPKEQGKVISRSSDWTGFLASKVKASADFMNEAD